ncbi:hypothetical protein O0I10_011763 [Lichtheimia ornata]|uniref:Uncharacterized protein n=1 Tax=Lichtheimia ornata TaxID=688661 RepID=A0AAD7USG3_9FUNG|nr:uncharacterized protein O0I10_011763 [Lichtheimia ornata]KAJ8652617.1 hypothetical protein O0I10_011763 [Lichtheimia ornata]
MPYVCVTYDTSSGFLDTTLPAMDLSACGIMALAKLPRLQHLTLYGTEQPELQQALEDFMTESCKCS